jgi:hypothetical protein
MQQADLARNILRSMEVFVIPSGRDRYALYWEVAAGEALENPVPSGIVGRVKHQFNLMLWAAEAREGGEVESEKPGWSDRLRRKLLRWAADRVAEQRLLWQLRRQSHATAVHPEDMSLFQARTVINRELQREGARHRNGLILSVVAFCLSGLVMVVPGPNLIAYYFAFRLGGHWLSLRGAAHGRWNVQWSGRGCQELLALREVVSLAPADRAARVHDVACRLHLTRLPQFFARLMVRAT